MPGIIKVKIVEGYDLPVMDRASDLTDAFVELRIGSIIYKTDVCRKSLNPQWDSDWFTFEIDDEDLQEEYLQVKVLDHDVYSSHDVIGKVNICLDLLLLKEHTNEWCGLYPIYDTLHGIRGYIRIKLCAQLFIDANKYRHTSCGVQFYSGGGIPSGYLATAFQSFVDERLVNNDPEYQWIDKLRTPRSSNEARIRLFTKLAGEIKRKIGIKVLENGGNAVIGYQQHFDLEGETGVIVRAIGTSVTLTILDSIEGVQLSLPHQPSEVHLEISKSVREVLVSQKSFNARTKSMCSEYDGFITGGDGVELKSLGVRQHHEIEFYTITSPPPGFIHRLGGVVSTRSVKLLTKSHSEDVEMMRDSWWKEIRAEISLHAKSLGCRVVIGYSETSTICDDLAVLSASGTAAVLQTHETDERNEGYEFARDPFADEDPRTGSTTFRKQSHVDISMENSNFPGCHMCHLPYSECELSVGAARCHFCRQDRVPEILFSTIDLPDDMLVNGEGCLIQARVIRLKKKEKDEANAENVSQLLPFLEFDMHQQIKSKLKIKGMNAIFGLLTTLTIAEQVVIGVMTGTGVCLAALPPSKTLHISQSKDTLSKDILDCQARIVEMTKKNKIMYKIQDLLNTDPSAHGSDKQIGVVVDECAILNIPESAYVVESGDIMADANLSLILNDPISHEGFFVYNTQSTTDHLRQAEQMQFFSLFKRVKIPLHEDVTKMNHWLASVFDALLTSVWLKCRNMMPCCVRKTAFDVAIDDDEYLQVSLTACAVGLDDRLDQPPKKLHTSTSQPERSSSKESFASVRLSGSPPSFQSPVIICCMDSIPHLQVTSYVGNINMFLIRECAAVKEEGGLSFFVQHFLSDIHAVIRAHVLALNGNAILTFRVNKIMLQYNPHKNHAHCLVNVSGDAVHVIKTDTAEALFCHVAQRSPKSELSSSPVTPHLPEIIDELKFKLDRAVYGTNV